MSLDIPKFIAGVHSYLGKAISPLTARMNAMEARLNVIEAQSRELKYLGVWEAGRMYQRHNAVTCGGNLWIARKETTTQKPGDGPDWQLAVRRGKDGKDAAA